MPETRPTDLIALVDDDDRRVGAIERRELPRDPGLQFQTAHIFAFDEEGRILLQRLAPQRDRHPLTWGSSVAAFVHAGESYLQAASRRAHEELGLDQKLVLVGKTKMSDLGGTKHIALFSTLADTTPKILERTHIAEIDWFRPPELRALIESWPESFTPTFLLLYRQFFDDAERHRRHAA